MTVTIAADPAFSADEPVPKADPTLTGRLFGRAPAQQKIAGDTKCDNFEKLL